MPKSPSSSSFPLAVRCVVRRSTSAQLGRQFRIQKFASTSPKILAQQCRASLDELWFSPSSPRLLVPSSSRRQEGLNGGTPGADHKPPDERILKLGKTLRILSPLLPTILINPLPLDILSPSITLHLFPSTHPHLPIVKGRVLYRAALWTVPVAWSSVPLLGNVRLQINSERIVRAGSVLTAENEGNHGDERLVVRWKTENKDGHSSTSTGPSTDLAASKNGTNKGLGSLFGGEAPIFKLGQEGEYTGLFIFSFDEKGRISSHTIEHADQANGWDRTAKFVTLTDWLLGKARGSMDPSPGPGFAMQTCEESDISLKGRAMKDGAPRCR
ncbi:hypothetical protein Egran_01812 [Elaphomyces granulatus]|uniref:Uncharacterized protein n=1 Tax=Elaphomyces granulatus TaxID=519963 RepID=A0A232M2W8_9EURO|nr:hypothetical protein Egran_01812 [Elaphomyces granulatus]